MPRRCSSGAVLLLATSWISGGGVTLPSEQSFVGGGPYLACRQCRRVPDLFLASQDMESDDRQLLRRIHSRDCVAARPGRAPRTADYLERRRFVDDPRWRLDRVDVPFRIDPVRSTKARLLDNNQGPRYVSSVLRRMLDVIDHQDVVVSLTRNKLETELFLNGRRERRAVGIDRWEPFAVKSALKEAQRREGEIPSNAPVSPVSSTICGPCRGRESRRGCTS